MNHLKENGEAATSVAVKISKYSNAEYRYKHHSFTETAVCRQSLSIDTILPLGVGNIVSMV